MAILETIYRGQSAPIDLTITDDDGLPINLATFDDIWITIYHKYSKIVMETFQDSLGEITTIDAVAGELRVILNDDDTEDKQTGIYTADIRTVEPDVDYDGNERYRASSEDVFILKPMEA